MTAGAPEIRQSSAALAGAKGPFRIGFAGLSEVQRMVWAGATPFVKRRLALVLGLVIGASAINAVGPLALKGLVDGLVASAARPSGPTAALLVGLYVGSQWLSRTVGEARSFLYSQAERRTSRLWSERVFAHLMQLPLGFHLQRQTGALTQMLQNGLQGYQMVLQSLMFTVFPVATELGTIAVIVGRLHRPVFLALFTGALLFYAVAFAHAARTTVRESRRATAAQVEASAVLTDSLLNYEIVKNFAAERAVQARVNRSLALAEEGWVGFYRRYAGNGIRVALIFSVFLLVTLLYASHEVQARQMSIGTFVLVNTYMLQIVRPVEMLGYAMQHFSQGLAFLEKLIGLLHEEPERSSPSPHEEESPGPSGPGELTFEDIWFSYRPDQPVLKGVSFRVPAGQTLGIVGESGAGKSSLVRMLLRSFEPFHGRILLDGVPISSLPLPFLRRAVAVVPQETFLLNDTLACNIEFGNPGSTREEIEGAARLARLHDFILSLPEGYETRIGERGALLSGGEKQRVSIARAAIKRPRLYVFDEATSSLDTRTEREIVDNLREISRATTTIVIAHRLSTVVHADQIIVLERGAVVERGTHTSLLDHNGRYASLWRAQQGDLPDRSASDISDRRRRPPA